MKGSIRLTQRLLHLMCAAVLMTGLCACGKSEETVEVPVTPEKPTPEVPVNNDDWQTVSPAGGTVEKGDISISFPSGTFDKDAWDFLGTDIYGNPYTTKNGIGIDANGYYFTFKANAEKPATIVIS